MIRATQKQHKHTMPRANPYDPKSRARIEARALARPHAVKRKNRLKALSLQRAMVQSWRYALSPYLNLPHFALIGFPSDSIPRSWFGGKAQLKSGAMLSLPPLMLPLLSQNRAHNCLWLWPCSGPVTSGQNHIRRLFLELGHSVAMVHNLEQFQSAVLAYFGAIPEPGPPICLGHG